MFKTPLKTKEPDNLEKAYDTAVFLLSLRLRTVGEVLKKMEGRGYTEQVINEVIERLKQQKYLDDQRYAEIYLENLKKYKSFGFYGIKKKLMEKKLSPKLIDQILEEGYTSKDEIQVAKRFLKKEGFEPKNTSSDEEVTYHGYGYDQEGQKTLNHSSARSADSGVRARLAQKLKARGFRGEVISKLVF